MMIVENTPCTGTTESAKRLSTWLAGYRHPLVVIVTNHNSLSFYSRIPLHPSQPWKLLRTMVYVCQDSPATFRHSFYGHPSRSIWLDSHRRLTPKAIIVIQALIMNSHRL